MASGSFADHRQTFLDRVSSIVWPSVVTIDTKGRPRSRMLHPMWEITDDGPTGWIATGRESLKAKHLAGNSFVSVTYWDPRHEQVMAECDTEWVDDMDEKQRLWDLFKATPEPYGYDLGAFWKDANDPTYGLLKLKPWRIEMWTVAEMSTGVAPTVWTP